MTSLIKQATNAINRNCREVRSQRESLRRNRADLAKLGRVFGKNEVILSNWYGNLSVMVQLSDLDSFKVGALPKMLEKLIDAGVEFTRSNDYPEQGNRDFSGKYGGIEIRVAAYLSEASKQCSVQVISEEQVMTTIKKYAIVC